MSLLLSGVVCLATRHKSGDRQIHLFFYPGDIVGLQLLMLPHSAESSQIHAVTDCSIATIDRDALEQGLKRDGALVRALWDAAIKEASILRRHLVVARRPALQRVAHLLCEQLLRLGIDEGTIPLSQIDVADAVGLSVVHTSRIFQELRQLGLLSNQKIEVLNGKGLRKLAAFDGSYLDPSPTLSRWDLQVEP